MALLGKAIQLLRSEIINAYLGRDSCQVPNRVKVLRRGVSPSKSIRSCGWEVNSTICAISFLISNTIVYFLITS